MQWWCLFLPLFFVTIQAKTFYTISPGDVFHAGDKVCDRRYPKECMALTAHGNRTCSLTIGSANMTLVSVSGVRECVLDVVFLNGWMSGSTVVFFIDNSKWHREFECTKDPLKEQRLEFSLLEPTFFRYGGYLLSGDAGACEMPLFVDWNQKLKDI